MKKVRIDFAPPSLGRALFGGPRLPLFFFFMSLCLLPSLVGSSLQYRDLLREQARRQARVEAAGAARASAAASAPAPARAPVPAAQAGAVNADVMQLNLPWRALHDTLESSTPASVALLALEPDAKKSNVRITAEAKSSDDMIGYVEALKGQDWFTSVNLVRHEINEQDPNRPIRFQIDAEWKAAP